MPDGRHAARDLSSSHREDSKEHKAGIIQVLQYTLLISGRFNTEYMVNLMDLVVDGDELATYTYYYLAFEDGFKKVTDKLTSLWMAQKYRQKCTLAKTRRAQRLRTP